MELLFTQDLAFAANYGFTSHVRKRSGCKQKSICATNEVRNAIFAWIFTRYWNKVNGNIMGFNGEAIEF